MSKISKALDKYKKEHNLSSAQIFNLEDAKLPESSLKEEKDRSTRKGVGAEAAKQSVQPHPPQKESIAPRRLLHVRPSIIRPNILKWRAPSQSRSENRTLFWPINRLKRQSLRIKNKEKTPHREDEAAVLSGLGFYRNQPRPRRSESRVGRQPTSIETEIFKVLRAKILFPISGSHRGQLWSPVRSREKGNPSLPRILPLIWPKTSKITSC